MGNYVRYMGRGYEDGGCTQSYRQIDIRPARLEDLRDVDRQGDEGGSGWIALPVNTNQGSSG